MIMTLQPTTQSQPAPVPIRCGSLADLSMSTLRRIEMLERRMESWDKRWAELGELGASAETNYPRRVLQVQAGVAESYGLSVDAIRSPAKMYRIVEARHLAIWLCAKLRLGEFVFLGKMFNKNHASILYARKTFQDRIDTEPDISRIANEWLAKLKTSQL